MSLKDYRLSYALFCIIGIAAMFSTSLVNPLLSVFAKQIGAVGMMIGFSVAGALVETKKMFSLVDTLKLEAIYRVGF